MQADGALVSGEAVVLVSVGDLHEALLAPQLGRAVVVWGGLLEPRLVEGVALQGRDGRSLQTPVLHHPVILLLTAPPGAAGVEGGSDVAVAEELQGRGMADA